MQTNAAKEVDLNNLIDPNHTKNYPFADKTRPTTITIRCTRNTRNVGGSCGNQGPPSGIESSWERLSAHTRHTDAGRMRPKDTCWDRLPASPSPSRIGGGVLPGGRNLTGRRGGIRSAVRPGRRNLTGRRGGIRGRVCPGRRNLTGRCSGIKGTVRPGRWNLTGRRGGIRGIVRPGRRTGIRGTARPGRWNLTGGRGGIRGTVRPGRRDLTGRRGEIRGTVRPSRRNLTGRRGGMRGKVLPGMQDPTDGCRRGIRSAVCRIRRGFGRGCSGFGRKVQGCGRIGKARTDQLHREATNDSKQCKNRCNCPEI